MEISFIIYLFSQLCFAAQPSSHLSIHNLVPGSEQFSIAELAVMVGDPNVQWVLNGAFVEGTFQSVECARRALEIIRTGKAAYKYEVGLCFSKYCIVCCDCVELSN